VLLDLARGRAGEFVEDFDALRRLLASGAQGVEVLDQGGEVGCIGAGAQNQEGADAFSVARIGHGDGGGLGDGGVPCEQALDLERGQVLAAANDDVLDAVRDGEVSVGVDEADVSRAEPALFGECIRVEGGVRVAQELLGPISVLGSAGPSVWARASRGASKGLDVAVGCSEDP
jgi:hypothetical protein